ncbi:MAG TPA: hemolysin, partial [Aliiroseovarius sp.]|nr:hemolysin [Aliiroseovarius sp.]
MAQYTVTAFKWTGTFYNAQYTTSYSAIFDDNDPNYEGGGDADESVSIDNGPFQATASSPYNISVSFTDVNGDPFVEDFYFFNTGNEWYFVPGPGSAFTVGATLGSYQSHTVGWQYADIICFTSGTFIETDAGPRLIEDLRPGDMVTCADGSYSPLRLIMRRDIDGFDLFQNPNYYPVRILAGALGAGIPGRDLLLSRQHRLLLRSAIAERMFGQREVLVSAIRLTALPGIFVDDKV